MTELSRRFGKAPREAIRERLNTACREAVMNSVVAQHLGRDEAEQIGSKIRESLESELRERIGAAARDALKEEIRERVTQGRSRAAA